MSAVKEIDVAVIGSGFGGIGTALSLAEQGYKVALFESLRYPGGCAGTFSRKGYRFEAGATLSSGFGEFQLFKKWIDQYNLQIDLEWLDPVIHFRSPNLQLDIPSNRDKLIELFVNMPKAPQEGIHSFFAHQKQVADQLWQLFDDPNLLPPWTAKTLWQHTRSLKSYLPVIRDMNRSLYQVLERYRIHEFKPLKIYLDALCQITVQCNTTQAEAPFALSTMDYYGRGTAHVIGGLGKLAAELCRAIQLCDGQVHLSNRVKDIIPLETGGYRLETRKGTYNSKAIVANLLPSGIKKLLPDHYSWPKWADQLQEQVARGWGAAMLYMVARTPPNSTGFAEHWQLVGDEDLPLNEGNHVFCSTSSVNENDRAPFGSQTLTLSTHVPVAKIKQMEVTEQAKYVQKIQARMRETFQSRCSSWSEEVYFAMTASPRTFEKFTSRPDGLVGGIPKIKGWQNYLHLGPRKLANDFYLVGDSTFPGQSTLATATGGQRVAYALGKHLASISQRQYLPSISVKSGA